MSLRRKGFAATAVTASLVTTLLTAPFSTAQVAADGTRTVNAPMSCQSFGKNGVSVDRTHTAPNSATTRYPSEVAPGEQFTFEYQPDRGSIGRTPSHNKGMWVGRMKYDITLPSSNATIGAPSVDLNSRERLSGWPSTWTSTNYHSKAANEVLAERLTSQGDVPDANGDILRIWGKDTRSDNRYTPQNSGGDDANVGIGVGNGRDDQTQAVGDYRLPKVTVPVTAGNSAGQDIIFGFRGAGTPDLEINNLTFRQPNNTLGFQEYYNQVVTLCRPTDNVPLATIKVVEPYAPEFTIAVSGDEAAGSERTVTATIPNNEVTGQVKFVATPKAGGDAIDLGTGEITNGKATATKKIDNPGDYTVTATLTSPRKVYEDSTATADLKVSAAASNVALVADQSLTVDAPGELKVTVAKGAQGKITISKNGTELGSTETIDADGNATVENVTLTDLGKQEVNVAFQPSSNAFEASESTGEVQVNDKQTSTLELGASKNDPKVNEAVTLTATVTPGEAKGSVQFKDGDNVLATENLNDNNEATYSYIPNTEGSKTITAVFVPAENSTFKGDTKTVELNVQPAAQDTGITLDVPATAKATEEVTLTANVEPTNVPGAVEFFNGTTSLGAGEYNQASGVATLKKQLPAGTYNVTATFTPTDEAAYNGKTSEAKQLEISKVATQVAYTGDTEGKPNEAITLRAKVEADGQPVDGGTVRFKIGTPNPVTAEVKNGVAEVTHTFASPGTRNVSAEYVPAADSAYTGNSATSVPVAIKDTATTTLTASKTDPIVGEEVTLTAKVNPAQAGGQVQLKDGDRVLETKSLEGTNNQATFTFAPENTNSKTLTAVYVPSENSNYTAGEPASVTITPKAAEQTTLTVAADPTSGTTNDEITLTATVPAGANGNVQFFNNGQTLGDEKTVNNGTATLTTTLPEGDNKITATFTSDNENAFTNATVEETNAATVTIAAAPVKTAPTVTVDAPAGEKTTEDDITLTAKVDPASAGTVEFFNGTTKLPGTVNYDPATGQATLTTNLPEGEYTVTAKFTPAADNETAVESTSQAAPAFTVKPATPPAPTKQDTSVALTADKTSVTAGERVVLKATSTPNSNGKVYFYADGVELGNRTAVVGNYTLYYEPETPGTKKITAKFVPNDTDAFNESPVEELSVEVAAVKATIALDADQTFEVNEAGTLTAKVTPAGAKGTVIAREGTRELARTTEIADNGTVALTGVTFDSDGDKNIDIEYVPAENSRWSGDKTSGTVKVNPATVTQPEKSAPEVTVSAPAGETTTEDDVTLTAKVDPASAGTVEFFNGDTKIDGTVDYDATTGEATLTTTLPAGDYTVTAKFTPADDNTTALEATSAPATKFTVTEKEDDNQQQPAPEATAPTVTVTAPTGETTTEDEVTLTAKVDPASAGTVAFYNGDTKIDGDVNYDAATGLANLTTTLPAGDYSVTAKFTPAADNTTAKEATSKAATFTVTQKEDDNQQPPAPEATAPTVTVTAPTGETTTEDEVTLTAKVDPASAGTVAFYNGDTKIDGDVNYDAATGLANLTTTLPAGDYSVTAKFTPAADNTTAKEATSKAATFTVTQKEDDNQQPPAPEATAPTVTVTAPTGETTTEDEVTLTAKVDPASAGTVAFYNGDTKIDGDVTYDAATGLANLTTTLPAGDYTITAKFTPAADNTTAKASISDAAAKFTVTKKHDDNQQPPAPNTPQSVEIAANGQEKVTVQDGNTTVKFSVKAAPGQSVTFKLSDGTKLGDVKADANGVATLVHDFKKAGTYTVTATAQDAPMPNDDGSSLAVEGKGVLAGTIIGAVLSLIVAIGSQTHIPGINNAITNMQRQLGIHNPQLAGQVERALPAVGALTGIAGLATAIGLLVKAIKDGDVKFEIKTNGNGGAGSSAKAPKNG